MPVPQVAPPIHHFLLHLFRHHLHLFHHHLHRYPTSIASLAFAGDGSVLAIASSYMYEQDNPPESPPEDAVYIRAVSDQETRPK